MTLKILRPTQQCGGGLEELKPVDQNLQYDFNYQQFTYLPEEITVYPVSVYECVYNTIVCMSTCVQERVRERESLREGEGGKEGERGRGKKHRWLQARAYQG